MITIFAAADNRLVAGLLVSVGFALVAIFLIASALSSNRRRNEVPAALRPGPSDEELESKTLPRFLAVGSIFLLATAVFLPAYWLREPTRIRLKEDQFKRESIKRGKIVYEPAEPGAPHFSANCARCHGADGEGAVQPFREKFDYAEPPLKYIVSRYKEAGRNDEEIRQLMYDAIERGRPNTLMPTWGLNFGGPLNSQQVDDVVNFLYSIQEEAPAAAKGAEGKSLFLANCNVCHSQRNSPVGSGGVGPDLRTVMSKLNPLEIFETIHDGRLNINRASMPTWAFLGDEAIRSIIQFLRTIQTGDIKPLPPSPSASPSASTSPSPTAS